MNLIKTYGIFRLNNNKIEFYNSNTFNEQFKWSDKMIYFIRIKSINYFEQKFKKFKTNKRSINYKNDNVGKENYLKRVHNFHKFFNNIRKKYRKYDIFILKINSNKPIKLKNGQYIQVMWKDRQNKIKEYGEVLFVPFKIFNSIENNK